MAKENVDLLSLGVQYDFVDKPRSIQIKQAGKEIDVSHGNTPSVVAMRTL